METNISITFRNLIYPSFDPNSIKLELEYENRYVEFSYPLNEPLKLTLSKKLISDKINMVLSIIELTKNLIQEILKKKAKLLLKFKFWIILKNGKRV